MRQVERDNVRLMWMEQKAICAHLSISRATLYRRVKAGEIERKASEGCVLFRPGRSAVSGVSSGETGVSRETGGVSRVSCLSETSGVSRETSTTVVIERLAQSELERGRLLERYESSLDEAVRLKLLARRQEQHIGDLQELVDQQNKVILELSAMVSKLWPGFNL